MNTTKLSKLLLGSALILGLGASNGSFAQQAQQMIIGEAAVALIQSTQTLAASAQTILGGATLTGSAQQVALLQAAINDPSNVEGAKFAAQLKIESVSGKSAFHRAGMASKKMLAALKIGVAAFVAAAGLNAAEVQTAVAGLSSPVGQKVLGNGAIECVQKWSDPTAKNSAARVFVAMGKASSVEDFRTQAVKSVAVNFKGETAAQVEARLGEAMNSEQCDIARVKGLRAARE